jgi:site-specific DNA recombinase
MCKNNYAKKSNFTLTEEMIRNYIQKDKQIVLSADLLECKTIISTYLQKVVVYEETIEYIWIVDFNGGGGPYLTLSTSLSRDKIYKQYSKGISLR